MITEKKEMTISQTNRAEPKSALRRLIQRLGLTLLASTLSIGASEAQQVAPPIRGLLEKFSHLQAARSTFRHLQAWSTLMSKSPSQPISSYLRI